MFFKTKLHQTGRKRQNTAKTGNDWDYYYDRWDVHMLKLENFPIKLFPVRFARAEPLLEHDDEKQAFTIVI